MNYIYYYYYHYCMLLLLFLHVYKTMIYEYQLRQIF